MIFNTIINSSSNTSGIIWLVQQIGPRLNPNTENLPYGKLRAGFECIGWAWDAEHDVR